MDHFYKNIQGWFNYSDLYTDIVKNSPDNFKFAEIGVWKGQSLSYFAVEAINSGKKFEIYAIDSFLGSPNHKKNNLLNKKAELETIKDKNSIEFKKTKESLEELQNLPTPAGDDPVLNTPGLLYETFLENTNPIKDKIKVIRKSSVEAASLFSDNYFDAVFIDASHDYLSVKNDLNCWFPKVKKVLYGHDLDWPGVKKAVIEFSVEKDSNFSKISETSYCLCKK